MAVEEFAKKLASELHPGERPHHILIAQQFSLPWMEQDLFPLTKKMKNIVYTGGSKMLDSLSGKRVRGLFYEPSTRTYESFESATELLGGRFSGLMNAGQFSSAYKGESTHDSMIIRNGYQYDCFVIRHDLLGGVEEAAASSKAPVINAGDGTGQHPTQAALDVFTIHDELGHIGDQKVLFVGDLKYGRTDHSLAYLLAKFPNMHLDFVSHDKLRMKSEIIDYLEERDVSYSDYDRLTTKQLSEADVVYVTRIQQERLTDEDENLSTTYNPKNFRIDMEAMSYMKPKAIVMHPLPRLDELPVEVDSDPRAAYFRQAENGLYVRMALLQMILGRDRE